MSGEGLSWDIRSRRLRSRSRSNPPDSALLPRSWASGTRQKCPKSGPKTVKQPVLKSMAHKRSSGGPAHAREAIWPRRKWSAKTRCQNDGAKLGAKRVLTPRHGGNIGGLWPLPPGLRPRHNGLGGWIAQGGHSGLRAARSAGWQDWPEPPPGGFWGKLYTAVNRLFNGRKKSKLYTAGNRF
jgi:hypothetical protein